MVSAPILNNYLPLVGLPVLKEQLELQRVKHV